MKKSLFICLLAILIVFAFIGCDDDQGPDDLPAQSDQADTTPDVDAVETTGTDYTDAGETTGTDDTDAGETTDTDVPNTDPVVTDPVVTDPVVTDPPVTDPPVTDPPVTDPPVTDPPVTDPPVVAPVLVSKITLSASKSSITVGESTTVTATVSPSNADNKALNWTASGGTVDSNGKFTATTAGTYTITATAKDGSGKSATITVTVKAAPIKVTSVTISGASSVDVGKTIKLTADVSPSNAADKSVTWSITSGSSYASISSDGTLTAKAAGSVTVKASANDGSGKSGTFTVTVKAVSTAMWEGSGTKADPYLIRNLTDLQNISKVTDKSGYYFKQTADIDVSSVDGWPEIGTESKPFRHHYDGDGHKIKNIYFKESGGLVSYAKNATFKNIKIENATADSNTDRYSYLGAIVGFGLNCSFSKCTVSVDFDVSFNSVGGIIGYAKLDKNQTELLVDCHAEGSISGAEGTGGLIGYIDDAYDGEYYSSSATPKAAVKDCSADVTVNGLSESAGGLIGRSFGVYVEHCSATGDVTVNNMYAGGLIGYASYACKVAYCYATGDITCTTNKQYGGAFAGGLIGQMFSEVVVHDCYATGDIFAKNVIWSNCQDLPSMDGGPWLNYRNPCGSLIACIYVTNSEKMNIYNCYATGTVTAPNICEDDRIYCHGALVGCFYDNTTRKNVLDKSKYDQSDWAGFSENYIGKLENNYNIENLRTYYTPITQTNRYTGLAPEYLMPTYEYVEIISKSMLTDKNTFDGWDFTNVWKMGSNGPELR